MSEDLVNQLTLNYLISHTQLQKLNKKIKENQDDSRNKELTIYEDRLRQLFADLLVNTQPDDIFLDVKSSFDNFIDKSIYYFKMCDANANTDTNTNDTEIQDDIDYDKEVNDVESNVDTDEFNDAKDSEPILVKPRFSKKIPNGHTNISNVPINWFQRSKANYQQHQIMPKKDADDDI